MEELITKIEFVVKGITCSNCVYGITKFLEKRNAKNIIIDLTTGETSFNLLNFNESKKQGVLDGIVNGIRKLGYKVELDQNAHNHSHSNNNTFTVEKKFYLSLIFTTPLFFSMILPFQFLHNSYVQLLLCLPVYIIGVLHFGKSAYSSLKMYVPNMDVLIFIGSSAAFIYSLIGTFYSLGHNFLFYETAATIITLVLLGNLIEHHTVKKTTDAVIALSKVQATKAKKVFIDNNIEKITEVNCNSILKDDVLLVNTGDKIPVDGAIVWGSGSVDESMITGESIPADKNINDKVIGGTILYSGNIKIKATKVGKETVLSQIIELVKTAQSSKPAIQKLGDKVSSIFVPIVVLFALTTFGITYFFLDIPFKQALLNSIAVLVIACPCAMGLATPTAVAVGIGRAARTGILVKGGSVLEEFAKIKCIVFDKTGTLTTGNFKLKKINSLKDLSDDKILNIVYNLEQHSSHPIAKSLLKECNAFSNPKINLKEIKEEKGIGISAKDDFNNNYKIGTYRIAKKLTPDDLHSAYILKNEELIATLDITDEIKVGAEKTIINLKKNGIKTVLLSGDRKYKCEEIASSLGIDEVYSEKLPGQKLEIIENLSKQYPVAMVGDGINDAPALAKANIGVSLSDATDVAIQSAQIILLKSDINNLTKAFMLSRHTLITIKQNLFWAFFYNIVAIPVAALGLLNPMVAALTMAFSDVVIIGNSLRFKIKKIF